MKKLKKKIKKDNIRNKLMSLIDWANNEILEYTKFIAVCEDKIKQSEQNE